MLSGRVTMRNGWISTAKFPQEKLDFWGRITACLAPFEPARGSASGEGLSKP
jgi:hypothetical protein